LPPTTPSNSPNSSSSSTAGSTSDPDHLNASLLRYVGHPAYDINRLKADLARYVFLLGGDDDGNLFQPPTP
jgi:hypothetical protein